MFSMYRNRRQFAWIFLTCAVGMWGCIALTGCNTVEGAGEDLQGASNEVQEEF